MTSVLVADIGGTNARFALVDAKGVHGEKILKVADFKGPVEAAHAYLSTQEAKPTIGAFAVAGPVLGDIFELTNFNWKFSVEETRKELGLENLSLINDFHALALGILHADPAGIHRIGGGIAKEHGNIGVIGPGTGLGVASLVWDARTARYVAVPGEGPHVTLPTVNAREFALVQWLLEHRYSHVSAERVCSGKGLVNLYDAIRGVDHLKLSDLEPEAITHAAQNNTCDACKEALTLMLGFLGRIAGNLALTNMTLGGIYFAGGILPKLGVLFLLESHLRREFVAKGRFTAFVDEIPTFLVVDPFLALKGLRAHALGSL